MTTNLLVLRKQKGLTQEGLAKLLGISRGEFSRLENGWFTRVNPSVDKKLRRVFGSKWGFQELMKEPEAKP